MVAEFGMVAIGAVAPNLALGPAPPAHHHHHHHHHHQQHLRLQRYSFAVCVHAARNGELDAKEEGDDEDCQYHRNPALGGSSAIAETQGGSDRRRLLLRMGAGTASSLLRWSELGLGLASWPSLAEEGSRAPDCTITDKVYLEITKCPSIFSTSRESGGGAAEGKGMALSSSSSSQPPRPRTSSSFYCNDGEALGRIVIGLYGKHVPETVANFKAMCNGKAGSSYKGCLIHRILAGQYIMAGKQGSSREQGEVFPPTNLDRNLESVKSDAFKLRHSRPGTVSLCLSENDDEDQFKINTDYRNVEFLITTGPGPAPQLDNKNIVFGTVLEGLDVVIASAAVPTYKPSERIRQFNELASFLGDERASNARNFWYRPLKALYISDCGEL